nr:ribonuclease H-like domain-containing protein [Tanacetum cinerariifolium]
MELKTTQTSTTIQDYALWDVIKNGKSFKPVAHTTTNDAGTSTTLILGLVTTEEKAQKKNDVKARSMLLMALPNKHPITFNQYMDGKTLFAAIETRFGRNEATKKTQKTILKKLYVNFSATSTESLDFIFNRLQNIVSQLAVLGVFITQEDLNLKLLRSLPSEWNTHVVVWTNKSDLNTISIDDLYNNFKIVEQEVKGTACSYLSSQNMAFLTSSSTNSTNEVFTAYGVSTASTQSSTASTKVSTTSLNDCTLSDGDYFEDIDYVEASPPDSKLVSLKEGELTSIVMNDISDNSTNDPLMEVVDLFLASENSIPPGIENVDYDSEGDILFLIEFLRNDSLPLPEFESFNFDLYDDSSSPRPPKKPQDDGGILTTKVVDDIYDNSTRELYVHVLNVLPSQPTLCLNIDTLLPFSSENEDKVFNPGILSSPLLSHLGKITSDFLRAR